MVIWVCYEERRFKPLLIDSSLCCMLVTNKLCKQMLALMVDADTFQGAHNSKFIANSLPCGCLDVGKVVLLCMNENTE